VLNRAVPILKPGRSLRFIALPVGEDPDSLIRSSGPQEFAALLARARPLSQLWWDEELRLWPNDTPERRADLERRIMLWVDKINDRVVQAEYRRFFRERLAQLGRPGNGKFGARENRRRGLALSYGAPLRGETPPPPPVPGRAHRQVFLGLLLRDPGLIGDWVEELADLEMPEPELDRLQREILENCEAFAGLDAGRLQQHLGSCGFADTVGALARAIAAHAGFATGGEDDPEVIRNGLNEALLLLRLQAPGDLDAAERAFAADASDENWRRLKALKEREAEDGPVGGLNW
jgi:DNA primase